MWDLTDPASCHLTGDGPCNIARARCHTIPAGHAVTLEAPTAVNEAIRTHIDTH